MDIACQGRVTVVGMPAGFSVLCRLPRALRMPNQGSCSSAKRLYTREWVSLQGLKVVASLRAYKREKAGEDSKVTVEIAVEPAKLCRI